MKQSAVEWLVKELQESDYIPKDSLIMNYVINRAKEMEKQKKDEFAIEFNEWLIIKCDLQPHGVYQLFGEEYTMNELLEIYKKEKGL